MGIMVSSGLVGIMVVHQQSVAFHLLCSSTATGEDLSKANNSLLFCIKNIVAMEMYLFANKDRKDFTQRRYLQQTKVIHPSKQIYALIPYAKLLIWPISTFTFSCRFYECNNLTGLQKSFDVLQF